MMTVVKDKRKSIQVGRIHDQIEVYLNIDESDSKRFRRKYEAIPTEMEMTVKEKNARFDVQFGEIYQVDLGVNVGSEMDNARPVIVVSATESFNRFSKLITVIPITSSSCKYPSQFEVSEGNFILKDGAFKEDRPVTGVAKAEQIRAVSKGRFMYHLGELSKAGKSDLRKALKNHMGI